VTLIFRVFAKICQSLRPTYSPSPRSLSYSRSHNPFQSEFFTQCDLVLPLSNSSILSVPLGHPVDAYVCFLVFPSFLFFPLSFNNVFYKSISKQDVTNAVNLPSFILSRIFHFFFTLCYISSFLTRSVQLILFFLQQYISKLLRYFKSIRWSKCLCASDSYSTSSGAQRLFDLPVLPVVSRF
jgi:hypothetical protein